MVIDLDVNIFGKYKQGPLATTKAKTQGFGHWVHVVESVSVRARASHATHLHSNWQGALLLCHGPIKNPHVHKDGAGF